MTVMYLEPSITKQPKWQGLKSALEIGWEWRCCLSVSGGANWGSPRQLTGEVFPGMFNQEETPWRTFDTPERLNLSAGLKAPFWIPCWDATGSGWRDECLGLKPKSIRNYSPQWCCCPHEPDPNKLSTWEEVQENRLMHSETESLVPVRYLMCIYFFLALWSCGFSFHNMTWAKQLLTSFLPLFLSIPSCFTFSWRSYQMAHKNPLALVKWSVKYSSINHLWLLKELDFWPPETDGLYLTVKRDDE